MTRARGTPALVILAAGASARLKTCKALVELHVRASAAPSPDASSTPLARTRSTPLAHTLEAGRVLDGAPPLVVSGAEHALLARALPRGVTLVRNADWAAGRTGSVRVARDVRPGFDLCLAPVDVPRVPARVFAALSAAWERAGAPPRGWLAPAFVRDGRRVHGHPIVVGRALLEELSGFAPDTPLRALRERAGPCFDVEVDAPEILEDLDTPADLARLNGP